MNTDFVFICSEIGSLDNEPLSGQTKANKINILLFYLRFHFNIFVRSHCICIAKMQIRCFVGLDSTPYGLMSFWSCGGCLW